MHKAGPFLPLFSTLPGETKVVGQGGTRWEDLPTCDKSQALRKVSVAPNTGEALDAAGGAIPTFSTAPERKAPNAALTMRNVQNKNHRMLLRYCCQIWAHETTLASSITHCEYEVSCGTEGTECTRPTPRIEETNRHDAS